MTTFAQFIHPYIHLFMHAFIYSFIHFFIHSLIHSFTFIKWLIHNWLIDCFIHSFILISEVHTLVITVKSHNLALWQWLSFVRVGKSGRGHLFWDTFTAKEHKNKKTTKLDTLPVSGSTACSSILFYPFLIKVNL